MGSQARRFSNSTSRNISAAEGPEAEPCLEFVKQAALSVNVPAVTAASVAALSRLTY